MNSISLSKDYRLGTNKTLNIILPGGIQFGASAEEIKAALGEPTVENVDEKSTVLKYKDEANSSHYAEFNLYDGKLITYFMSAE